AAALYDAGRLTKENAEIFGISAEQAERFKRLQDQIVAGQVALNTKLRAFQSLNAEITNRYTKTLDDLNAKEETRLHNHTALVAQMMIENGLAREALNDRGLGGGQPTDPFQAALQKRDDALGRLYAQQAQAATFAGKPLIDISASVAKVWADFDAAMLKLTGVATQAAGGMDKLGRAATDAAKAIAPTGQVANIGAGPGGIRSGMLGANPILTGIYGPNPIVAGNFAPIPGVVPNVTMYVSGVWDPRSQAEMVDAVSKGLIRGMGRQTPAT